MSTIQPTKSSAPVRVPGLPATFGTPAAARRQDGLSRSPVEGASTPQQDKATASVVANLPRPCSDGCGCPACSGASASDPAGAFKARDQEVERHEQAHLSAAGPDATSTPSYETQTGPDGKSYRIGGHVNVSLRDDDQDPHETVQRMERIQRSALAPAQPSGQDMSVASQASQKETKAKAKLEATGGANS